MLFKTLVVDKVSTEREGEFKEHIVTRVTFSGAATGDFEMIVPTLLPEVNIFKVGDRATLTLEKGWDTPRFVSAQLNPHIGDEHANS